MFKNRTIQSCCYVIILSLVFLTMSGCAAAIFAPFYLIKGTDIDPEFKKEIKAIPKESKIIVVCRSGAELYGPEDPSAALSYCMMALLSTKLPEKKKFEWITFDKVEALFDETALRHESFQNIGEKVGADYLFGVDIDSFSTQVSPLLFQGRSKVHVQLLDIKNKNVVARKTLPQYVYPPNPVPINNKEPSEFQKQYTGQLANEIGTLFYPYSQHDKYAQDCDFLHE